MAGVVVNGYGPVAFTLVQSGTVKQVFIPLSALKFNGETVALAVSVGDLQMANPPGDLADLLQSMVDTGQLWKGAAPAPSVAFSVSAKAAGATGNSIALAVNYDDNDAKKFVLSVTQTEIFRDVTAANLGTSVASKLVQLVTVDATAFPPAALSGKSLELTGGATNASVKVAKDGDVTKSPFTVQALEAGDAGKRIAVTLTPNVDKSAFTLTVVWRVDVQGAVQADGTFTLDDGAGAKTPPQLPAALTNLIAIAADPPGATIAAPQAGTYALSGGADAATASAVAFTNS
jgi:hypothetical protein